MENGDIIKSKSNPFIYHYAVLYIDNGEKYLMHNSVEQSVILQKWEQFFKARELIYICKSNISGIDSALLLEKFNKLKVKRFDLLFYNCEHFVSELTGTKLEYSQLGKFLVLLILPLVSLWCLIKK